MSRSPMTSVPTAMKMFAIAVCACAVVVSVRADDATISTATADQKPAGRIETPPAVAVPRRGTAINGQSDAPLPNVSEDVLDKALSDRRFVQRQLKCATGEGPCDPIGRKIKAHAPLVMRGMCVKCSQAEIKQIQRVMSHIQKNYPKEYAKILKQYQSGF